MRLDLKPALLLIDLQNDYLGSPLLEPTKGSLCAAAETLLTACRSASIPAVHVWTTIRSDDERMPHWQAIDRRLCVEGTPGHAPPQSLLPRANEHIFHKRFYSAYTDQRLAEHLRDNHVDTVILVGVLLRGCVRTTAVDAYQQGFTVWIADDAVADDDPVHAAVTRRYLANRCARFLSVEQICDALEPTRPLEAARAEHAPTPMLPAMVLGAARVQPDGLASMVHVSPRESQTRLWQVPICGTDEVAAASAYARRAGADWSSWPHERRSELFLNLAERVELESEKIASQIAIETGKPIADARLEVVFAVDLVRSAVHSSEASRDGGGGDGWQLRRSPLGVVAAITPWNNPLAIPLGKIAPALIYGNTVVWKPAPAGASVAIKTIDLLLAVGLPPGTVNLVQGDRATAEYLMLDAKVDAVTLTGSSEAGYVAQVICAGRHVPCQCELGGNNAAIIWSDADLADAARQVAQGGFGSAGQRCTSNRRVIVDRQCHNDFLAELRVAGAALKWGDPLDDDTQVGPVVSGEAQRRIARVVDRAGAAGATVITLHDEALAAKLTRQGCYYPPTLVCCDDPTAEVVASETFGPVIVIQEAHGWEHAISLCNGVRQGLVAALFSSSMELRERFFAEAQAGLLKINTSTVGAAPDAPFGGWKASVVGPPEHGVADLDFYTRYQTIYEAEMAAAAAVGSAANQLEGLNS